MKRIVSLLGIFSLSLIMFMLPAEAMQAIAAHNPLASLSLPLQGNPEAQAHNANRVNIPSPQPSNSMALSSQKLGLSGPFELAGVYNSLTGANASINFTQNVTDSTALSTLDEYGPKMYRLNATVGTKISSLGLFKISAERLSQVLPFNFTTGAVDHRVNQNAYGGLMHLYTGSGRLQNIEVGGYYATAQSYSLSSVNYIADGISFRNDRNIAGGKALGGKVKGDILVNDNWSIQPILNYDSLHYSPIYSTISNSSHVGGGVYSTNIITPNMKTIIGTVMQATGNTYEGSIAVQPGILKHYGSELVISAARHTYPNSMPSSNSIMFSLNFLDLEGGFKHAPRYNLASNSAEDNINKWTKVPAVKMDEVYAVSDQRSVRISPILITLTPANANIAAAGSQQYIATATFEGGAQADISSEVVWSSSQTSVATINSTGLATGVATGTTSISASYLGVSGSTNLSVSSASPPVVTGIDPDTGPGAGGTSVIITGTDFTAATAVHFGATSASFTVDSDTQITATSPAGSGTVNITVTTPSGTSTTSSADEFYYAPTVTSLSVAYGSSTGGTSVVITGTGFTGTAGPAGVKFGATDAASYTVDSDTQITATSPAGVADTTVNVTVTNGGLTSANTSADDFTYQTTPVITGLSPDNGTLGTTVIITGTGFLGATGVNGVRFNATPAASYTVNSATQITAVAPAGLTGTASVTVSTGEGTSNGFDFEYN